MLTRPMLTPTLNVRLVPDEVEIRYRLPQLLGDAHRVLDRAVLQQHAELVAAQPRQRVAFAQPLAAARR